MKSFLGEAESCLPPGVSLRYHMVPHYHPLLQSQGIRHLLGTKEHQAHVWCTDKTCRQNAPVDLKPNNFMGNWGKKRSMVEKKADRRQLAGGLCLSLCSTPPL